MHRITLALLLFPALAPAASSPFIGHWDFNVKTPGRDVGANWLGVAEKAGALEIWFQPAGGNVYQVKDFKADGKHLTVNLNGKLVWDLNAAGNKLTGRQKNGDKSLAIEGMRAPELKRAEPKAWSTPEPLFNGKDLTGWEPIGDPAKSHWKAEGGMLVNAEHGANLKTTHKYQDFKVHFEVNIPDDANSGFYLRGRYENQLEYEPLDKNPPERRIGSIYGRIVPTGNVPRAPGTWETFDIMLVGRTVTTVHNGVTIIDHKEIEGITGGAVDANEAEPGPFYIQGDHTGGLKFRNITVSVPR
jgi:hypothetical protein